MKTVTLKSGKQITTNLYNASDYPTLRDDMKVVEVPNDCTMEEYLERCAEAGYKRVTFYKRTTCVKGYHDIYARRFR